MTLHVQILTCPNANKNRLFSDRQEHQVQVVVRLLPPNLWHDSFYFLSPSIFDIIRSTSPFPQSWAEDGDP